MIPLDEATVVIASQVVNDAAHADPIKTPARTSPPASRAARPTDVPTGWAAGRWDRFPAHVERSARCIAKHESWTAGLWKAENPVSTASGAFQFVDGTWRAVAARAGVGEAFSHASDAPPHVQAAVFAHQAMNHGLYPWKGTHCPGTE